MILNDIVIDMHQGINTVADKVVYQSSGIPIIQSKNFTKGYLDLEDVRYLGENDKRKYKDKYNPKKGDILLANIGTIGKSILINEDLEFLIAWNAFLIRINHNVFNANLLNFYFNYLADTRYFDRLLTGGTVKFVNKKKIGEIFIPDISLEKQSELCNVLTIITRIIQTQRKKIALLDELVKARFVEMFGDPKTNNKNLLLVKPNQICESISAGGDKPSEVSDTKNKEFCYPIFSNGEKDDGLYGWSKEYRIEKPAITVSGRGTIGYTSYRKSGKFTPIVRLITMIPNEKVNPIYLTYYFNFERETGSGSGVQQLTVPMIKQKEIMLPELNTQNEFAKFVEQIDKSKFVVQQKIKYYKELQDKLMDEYFGDSNA